MSPLALGANGAIGAVIAIGLSMITNVVNVQSPWITIVLS
jgi:hypothetical protein